MKLIKKFYNLLKIQGITLLWSVLERSPTLKKRFYRFYAWRIFEIIPILKKNIYKIYDKYWYLELLIENRKNDFIYNQIDKLEINIDRLRYYIKYNLQTTENFQKFEDNWDSQSNLENIEESNEFNLVKEHFLKNKKWEDIKACSIFKEQISKNFQKYNFSNENELLNFLNSLDELYQCLKNSNLNKIE